MRREVSRPTWRSNHAGGRVLMMPHGGDRSTPSVMAAFAGFVHDRESTANDQRNDDNDAYNAAGLNWWRINRNVGRNRRRLHSRVERERAGRLAFDCI